jgi:hypothetical protein
MDDNDLVHRFGFHPATKETGPMHSAIRMACLRLARELNDLIPDGREKSLAITHLEETMYWANGAVARSMAPLETP